MRRVKITTQIETWAQDYADEMEGKVAHAGFKSDTTPLVKLQELENQLRDSKTEILVQFGKRRYHHYKADTQPQYADYVKLIQTIYTGLNNVKPSGYLALKNQFNKLVPDTEIVKVRVKAKRKTMSFADRVVEAMRYDAVQSKIFGKYIRLLGFRSCVYCNAQFATTATVSKVVKEKGVFKKIRKVPGTFYELDHNLPKSVYPFLCTNFYNLQPCCGSCNRRKNSNALDYSVYYEDGDGSDPRPLHFALLPTDVIEFRTNNKCDNIGAHLCNAGSNLPPTDKNSTLAKKFENMFGVQGVYDEYKDLVEELLWRHKIYSKGYVSALDAQMTGLGVSSFDFKQYILGTYTDDKDAFKRPFTIMLQDLWEQLEGKKASDI